MSACCPENTTTEIVQLEYNVESQVDFLINKESRSEQRLAVCKTCPELFGPLNNCRQCGCFVNIKVRIYSAGCPLGKW